MQKIETGNSTELVSSLTFSVNYKAVGPKKSSIKLDAPEVPIDLHQMVVWILLNQQDAAYLIPAYREIREQAAARNEAQKTHCGQDI